MYSLEIDTTQRGQKKVFLLQDGKRVGLKEGDIDVVISIKELLEENKIKLSDISKISPNLGPGSFTGLKIGVTISNVLNWAVLKKKISDLDTPNYGSEPNIFPNKF